LIALIKRLPITNNSEMKKLRIIALVLFISGLWSCTTQKTILSSARVSHISQGEEEQIPAVSYYLPRTTFTIKVVAEKTTTKPGPFAAYAERYLGIKDVPTREKTSWQIKSVAISPGAERDPGQNYKIDILGESNAQYLSLTPDGVIKGVNLPMVPVGPINPKLYYELPGQLSLPEYADLTMRKHTEPMLDTVVRVVRTDTSFLRLPMLQSQISQKNLMNQAEEAATIITDLRARRKGILDLSLAYEDIQTNLPDGPALEVMLKELAQSEYDHVSLFVGRSITESVAYSFSYVPDGKGVTEVDDLFTFSTFRGVLHAGDANGDPVKIQLTKIDNSVDSTMDSSIEEDGNTSKLPKLPPTKGLSYRQPQRARLAVTYLNNELANGEYLIAQYGQIKFLPGSVVAVPGIVIEYHTELGAIKQITKK